MSTPTPFVDQGALTVPRDLRKAMWELIGLWNDENGGIDPFHFGLVYNVLGVFPFVGATVWGGVNEARYARAVGRGTISALRIRVTTQSGNISLGVYAPSGSGLNAKPGARKVTTGAIACPAAADQDIAITPTLVEPGDFFGMSCDNTTAAFIGTSALGATSVVAGQLFMEAAAHPLPATATPTANNFRHPMIVGVP
jgi:hypothetical protein